MAAKIKDGLFIGDAETSQSEVFINDNKISNLINLAGRDVPNVWASHGLVYLTYNWEDRPDYRLFTGHEDSILTDMVEFVDVSIAHGISVLMFSQKGTGRCAIAACLYLMVKYRWGFEKSYDYVYSKKPDIDLNKGFIQQMFALDMKLVASRQKAYALKHGLENSFRIEPNMTINDIAAMLPPNEAKRWNSWDPQYLLNPNNTGQDKDNVSQSISSGSVTTEGDENVTWSKYSDAVLTALRKKDTIGGKSSVGKTKLNWRALDDAEEELVLIFSFINAKNTISTLPGPFYNAYEIQKQFRIRFDNVHLEEDINMFPSSPPNTRVTAPSRSILKGSGTIATASSTTGGAAAASAKFQEAKEQTSKITSSESVPKREDKAMPSSSNNNSRSSADNGGNPPSKTVNSQSNNSSNGDVDNLYSFVGISAQAKEESSFSSLAKKEDKKASFDSNNGAAASQQKPMSAEDRLRKLMADMQKQGNSESSTAGSSGYSGRPNSSRNTKTDNAADDGYYGNDNNAPSLYDLANMHVQPASADTRTSSADPYYNKRSGKSTDEAKRESNQSQRTNDRPASGGKYSGSYNNIYDGNPDSAAEDLEAEAQLAENGDPLAAFDVPGYGESNVNNKGALRARHDILSSSTDRAMNYARPTGSKQAWGTTLASTSASRYTAGSPTAARGNPSSNASIGSTGSGDRVGSGSNTSTNVYR